MRQISLVVILLAVAFATAKPTNPPIPKKEAPKETPYQSSCKMLGKLAGATNWGHLETQGKDFTFSGHAVWDAIGFVRDDGEIVILWTLKTTGEPCPGIYKFDDGVLVGVWGYSHETKMEGMKVEGATRPDRIIRVVVDPDL